MPDCPTCGRSFDSRRGLGVHHSAAHDELLPNHECDHCGVEFHSEHEKRYCSDDCRDEAVSFEGEKNPNYRGGRTSTACEICGSNFEYYQSAKTGRYCESCVGNEQWRHERDDRRCVLCGTTKNELGRNPDVHHIVPVRSFVEKPVTAEFDAHYLENVVSLCPSCHRKAEFGGVSPDRLKTATEPAPNAEGL